LALRKPLLAALAVLAAVALFLAWKADKVVDRILDLRYGGVPSLPSLPKPRDLREANLQDLDYLARLLDYDRSFNDESRVEFTRRLARLRENAATLSRGELLMGISKAVAIADNPHTSVERGFWRAYLNSAPVRFEWFAEGLHVVRAREDVAELLGRRVVAVVIRARECRVSAAPVRSRIPMPRPCDGSHPRRESRKQQASIASHGTCETRQVSHCRRVSIKCD